MPSPCIEHPDAARSTRSLDPVTKVLDTRAREVNSVAEGALLPATPSLPQPLGLPVESEKTATPLRVLIVEDNDSDVQLMLYELRRSGFVPRWHHVQTAQAFLQHLTPALDVILSDYNLPEMDALIGLHLLQESGLDIPFIVVTGSISEEVAVECMKEGATDYLLKDRLARLGQAVKRALDQKRLHEAKRQAEDQIKASLREKEVLLQEIHHRVKNNLQIISSLLNLQSESIAERKVLEIIQESQNRIKSMALVHEQLYQSKDLSKIDLAQYIQHLVSGLFHSYATCARGIALKVEADHLPLGIDTAIPCGLILHELVSNCLKHAFPGGRRGEIAIDFRSELDGRLTLTVRDNGVGLPENIDVHCSESLGLQLVNTLTNQLNGTLAFSRATGTTFKVTFRELKYKERK